MAGRRQSLLDEIAAAYPGMEGVEFDASDPASITRLADTATAAHPDLNVLVTMAGIMVAEQVLDLGALDVAERSPPTCWAPSGWCTRSPRHW